jgi:hypothetical protein
MTHCHHESCSNPTASSCAMPKISSAGALIVQLTILCYMCSEEMNLDGFMFTRGITISSFLAIYSSSLDWPRRLRLERFQQLLPRPEPSEEYCPLYTLVDDAGAC